MRRGITLICVVLLLSLLLCSCSQYKQIEPSEQDMRVVGDVQGKQVYLDELRFAAYTCYAELVAQYGEDAFKGEDAEKYFGMLCEAVYSSITADYAVLLLCEEALIGLGESAVTESVDQKMQSLVDELGGMGKYKKYLKENHLSDRYLRRSTEISLLQNELMYVYTDDLSLIENNDEKIYDIIKDEFIVVRHIFVSDRDADKIALADAELNAGADFAAVMQQYNQDTQMSASGEFILHGYASEKYESVAFSLKVGERSRPIQDSGGYYIIERREMSISDLMLKFDYLKQLWQTHEFYAMIDAKQAELTFNPNRECISFMRDTFLS